MGGRGQKRVLVLVSKSSRKLKEAEGRGEDDSDWEDVVQQQTVTVTDKKEEVDQGQVINPMENPVVLARLFQVCDLNDLRRFRLVNKQWHAISLTRWRAEMNVILIQKAGLKFVWERDYLGWVNMPLLYWTDDELTKLHSIPFKTYRLFDVKLTRPPTDMFLEKFGPSMSTLDLRVHISNLALLKKIVFEKTPNLETLRLRDLKWNEKEVKQKKAGKREEEVKIQPNLTSLMISCDKDEGCKMPISWQLLFMHFPNIGNLELKDCGPQEIGDLVQALEQMTDKSMMTIKSLDISDVYKQDPEVVKKLLQQKQMKLESLLFQVNRCEDEAQGVLPLALHLHGKSLKKLVLRNGSSISFNQLNLAKPYDNFPFTQHPMTSLTELHLKGNVCPNLYFLGQTPILRVLRIYQENEERILQGTDSSRIQNLRLSGVVEFCFDVYSFSHVYTLSKEKMKMLTTMMPNVKVLEAPVSAAAVPVFCENWKELTHLKLKGSLNDRSVVGLVREQGAEHIPNLTDLKYLRELKIDEGCRSLTDTSVYNGFLRMSYLHTLHVTMSERTSDKAVSALFSKFPGTELKRHIPSGLSKQQKLEKAKINSELERKGINWRHDFGTRFP